MQLQNDAKVDVKLLPILGASQTLEGKPRASARQKFAVRWPLASQAPG
jgi:hypothetical protein